MATRRTDSLLKDIREITGRFTAQDELSAYDVRVLVEAFDALDVLICKGESPQDWANKRGIPSEHLIRNIYELATHLRLKDPSPAGINVDWFLKSPGGVRIHPSIMGVSIHGGHSVLDPKPPVHELLYPFDKASLDMILQQAEKEST